MYQQLSMYVIIKQICLFQTSKARFLSVTKVKYKKKRKLKTVLSGNLKYEH